MHQNIIFAIFFLLIAKGMCEGNYCALWPKHVMCVNPPVGPACGSKFAAFVPDEKQQQIIVDSHNKLRQKVALGNELRGLGGKPQPPAANMMKIQWDPELAKIAQRTANQCITDHDCNECRRVLGGRFGVGQSMAYGGTFVREIDFPSSIQMWYDEVPLMDPKFVDSYEQGEGKWGHYTQVVWWNSRSIGCGAATYENNGLQFLIVCNYGTGANMPGAKVYVKGTACSQCPAETKCDSTYNGLCSITRSPFNVVDKFPIDQVYLGLPPGTIFDV